MAKFLLQETVTNQLEAETVRLGAGTGSANNISSTYETGKPVKLVGESRYDLCVAGNPIEAIIVSVESFTQDGYSIGSIQDEGYKNVVFDGLQATAGTGVVAIGDYVVTGTVVAKGTALAAAMKVCKATNQPGAVPADLTAAGQQAQNAVYAWRVVSLGSAGTGAVGTAGVIERANY